MSNVEQLLVTTGLLDTWGDDQDIIFLGEWCKPYNLKSNYDKRRYSTIPYHWNDSKKLRRDHGYLCRLHERVLAALAKSLNDLHNVSYSLRYWRIILGPWLLTYISTIWDRWENLRIAFEEKKFSSTIIVALDNKKLVPIDYDDFVEHFLSDIWNHHIFTEMLKFLYEDKVAIKTVPYTGLYPSRKNIIYKKSIKEKIITAIDELFGRIQKNYKIVFVSSYFSLPALSKISFRLKQLPRIHSRFLRKINVPEYSEVQRSIKFEIESVNRFEQYLENNIIKQIPIAYLEGYENFKNETDKIDCDGEIIFTANAHLRNDVFNAWCAKKVEGGRKLIISQHGGGIKSEMTVFRHQEKIADKMVVWHKPLEDKHVRLSPNKLVNLNINHLSSSELTIVGYEPKIYTYRTQSGPMGSGIYDDYVQKLEFSRYLSPAVSENIRVRTSAYGTGYFNSLHRYKDDLGENKLSVHKTLREAFEHSRIIVCTYPQTTLSEAMNSGVPTILLYSEHLWPIDQNFKQLLRQLKDNKIVFACAKEAADHINKIWSNPEKWWASSEIVQVRESFFDMCGRVSDEWLDEWGEFFEGALVNEQNNTLFTNISGARMREKYDD